ncbi:uncharacterized protein LOC134259266 isoform X2 [Saccostrea cucullata]|uniref:uncharacterized protein LOC134259266 isoform X2 n=1 Tax=Saccostrea cuccullata TaxID=36930 RepID=UPI002ED681A5
MFKQNYDRSKKLRYAVVEFTEEEEVEVVPVKWLATDEKTCYWPNMRSTAKISGLIKAEVEPKENFKQLPVRVLAKAADYEDARKKLSKAIYTSDLQTDTEETTPKRAKRPNPRFISSDSEEDDTEPENIVHRRQSPRKQKRIVPDLPPLPSLPSTPQAPRPSATVNTCVSKETSALLDRSPMNGQATEKKLFNCLDKLLTTVEELKVQAHINTKLLQSLMGKIDGINGPTSQDAESSDPLAVDFPLKSKEELEKLEDLLLSSENTKNFVRSLSTIGGDNVKTNVRRLLAHLFSTDLAKTINWIGKGGKTAFSTLKVKDILTVRKNRLCPSATDAEIFDVAKTWFRFASDRDGGRKKREEKKKEKAVTDDQCGTDEEPTQTATI